MLLYSCPNGSVTACAWAWFLDIDEFSKGFNGTDFIFLHQYYLIEWLLIFYLNMQQTASSGYYNKDSTLKLWTDSLLGLQYNNKQQWYQHWQFNMQATFLLYWISTKQKMFNKRQKCNTGGTNNTDNAYKLTKTNVHIRPDMQIW